MYSKYNIVEYVCTFYFMNNVHKIRQTTRLEMKYELLQYYINVSLGRYQFIMFYAA